MKRAAHVVISTLTVLGITCVALLVFYFCWREVRTQQAHLAASRIADQLEAQFPDTMHSSADSPHRSNSYVLPDLASIPLAAAEGSSYIGIISIPTRDVELPLKYSYTQMQTPSLIGPFSSLDTPQVIAQPEAGRWVIEGPSIRGVFKDLVSIPDGEEVTLTLLDGSSRRFFVLWAESIASWDQSRVFETQESWDLTLAAPSISGFQYDVLRLARV